MTPIMRLYLKVFLYTGLPFALLMMVLDVLSGDTLHIARFISHFVVFGGLMSLVLVSLHRYQLTRKGVDKLNDSPLSVVQKTRIQTTLSRAEIINRLKSAPAIRRIELSEDGNSMTLHTGVSWRSWGEKILLSFHQTGPTTTVVEVESNPKLRTTVVDYGKNRENVKRIEELLGSYS